MRASRHTLPTSAATAAAALPSRYYPALRPCEHFLPFWRASERDVVGVLEALQRGGGGADADARRMAAASQALAAELFTEAGQLGHWQAVIDRYTELYRGPKNAKAAKAAKARAEMLGMAASAAGEETQDACRQGGRHKDWQKCWLAGLDAAQTAMSAAITRAQVQQASQAAQARRQLRQ